MSFHSESTLAAFYFLLEVEAEQCIEAGETSHHLKGLETLQRAAEGDFERGERQRLMKELRGVDRKDYRATTRTGSNEAVPSRARGGSRGGRGGGLLQRDDDDMSDRFLGRPLRRPLRKLLDEESQQLNDILGL